MCKCDARTYLLYSDQTTCTFVTHLFTKPSIHDLLREINNTFINLDDFLSFSNPNYVQERT